MSHTKNKIPMPIIAGGIGLLVIASGFFGYMYASNMVERPTAATEQTTSSNANQTKGSTGTQSQEDMLNYLIEEEKLAHDVYTVMYEKYGARVFGNILQSESTHQSRVLTLLEARSMPDPRTSELGKFNSKELQELYDKLIAQGNRSAEEAYKVGVAIEEKDIADITRQLATATDSDVVSTLEALRSASENHLRAFNRQLGN